MRKVFLIALWLFAGISLMQAQDAASVMTQTMQLYQTGNYSEMAILIENNRKHLEQSEMFASFLYILGIAYTNMGDYAKAETTYLEEKTKYEKTVGKEHPGYINALFNLGYIYRKMGDDAKAETCYLEAKTIREKVVGGEHADYAATVSQLADLYHEMGDDVKAEATYREVKTIQEKVLGKENITYATTLNNLATVYCAMSEYAKAETCYRESIAILATVLGREHPNYAFTLGNLGMVYRHLGNYFKAEAFYLDSKSIQERVLGKRHPAYALSLNNLADLYKEMGDDIKAETYYREEKDIWENWGREHPNHVRSLNDLGSLYLRTKNYPKAEAAKIEADQIVTAQIEKYFTILSGRQRAIFWDKNKHHFEQAYSYAHANPANAIIAHAYDNTLFTKGLLLRTANGIRDAIYSSGNHDIIEKYEQLGSIRQMITTLQSKDTPDPRMTSILENRADSLDKALAIASAAYKDLKSDISMNWQHVRDVLQTGEAAVEFVHYRLYDGKEFTGKTFYCAMVLKKNATAPVHILLCEEDQLQAVAKREKGISDYNFTKQLYSGIKGENLYRLIWLPLEKELQNVRTVYYSPSGMLHQIAYSAIPADSVLLSDKYDLRLVSSAREIVRLKKDRAGTLPKGSAAVYGGLYYDVDKDQLVAEARKAKGPTLTLPQWEEKMMAAVLPKDVQRGIPWNFLRGTETEAEQICNYLNERKISNRLYAGTEGNEESFKRLNGTPVGIIHLATHGFFLADIENEYNREIMEQLGGGRGQAFENPLLRSGLLLAGANNAWAEEDVIEGVEDGILTADEIAQMNLIKTQIVVLSACETGLGEVKGSEGVFGLQRAFKLAGVETIVMSLWTVPDDATAELMSGFYKQWLSGKTKRDAFAASQRQVREKYKETYHWAGFVMLD